MEKYISKSAVNAEIKRLLKSAEAFLKYHHNKKDRLYYSFDHQRLTMCELLSYIDTLEVKEVDFAKEFYTFSEKHKLMDKDIEFADIEKTASFFFQLGLKASNPITAEDRGIAEEIIISLKQVENDYYLDQTKEIEWVRNKVKEEEEI